MFKSLTKIFLALFLVVSSMAVLCIAGTNAFFTDSSEISGTTFSAGYWIPVLTMTVDPENPNGDNNFYVTKPCVTLTASITDSENTRIFYRLESGESYAEYIDSCIEIPDGEWDFDAYAIFDNNSDWKSNSVSESFKIDTVASSVKINEPDNDDEVSESINIKATVQDENSHHYWLVIENEDGTVVAGPGTVNETDSFEKRNVFTWDTTKVPDGEYTIKLEARDEAGNKDPDQAPVTDDPEVPGDSVDWITVEVNNIPEVGSVVINEIMWMGSFKVSDDFEINDDVDDEWIELRNMTGEDINIKGWQIEGAVSGSSGHLEIAGDAGDDKDKYIIPAHGFFLISNFDEDKSAIDVKPDLVKKNLNFNNYYNENDQIILKDKTGKNTIDQTPNPTSSKWPAGKHGVIIPGGIMHYSMERNDDPDGGTDYSDWHTCDPSYMSLGEYHTMISYWDDGAKLFNAGTPGDENLSQNDHTSLDFKDMEKEVYGEDWEKKSISEKKVEIEFSGEPDVAENLTYEVKQKIDKVEISGKSEDLEEIEKITYDLTKIEIDSAGEKTIKISDLKLPKGITIKDYKSSEVVFLITTKEIILEKEIKIEFKGELDLVDGLAYEDEDVDQKIKKIKVSGTEKDIKDLGDKITVDLSKLDEIEKKGDFHFRIEDLNFAKGISVKGNEMKDVILEIKISEEEDDDDDEDEDKKDDTKKEDEDNKPQEIKSNETITE